MLEISKDVAMELMDETSFRVYKDELYYINSWAEQNGREFDIKFYLDDGTIVVHWVSDGQQVGESLRLHIKSAVGKRYNVRDSNVVRRDLVQVLEKGLGRSLTGQELMVIYWLGDFEYETVGVLSDLFKELTEKKEGKN
jgi:hypothetical protein